MKKPRAWEFRIGDSVMFTEGVEYDGIYYAAHPEHNLYGYEGAISIPLGGCVGRILHIDTGGWPPIYVVTLDSIAIRSLPEYWLENGRSEMVCTNATELKRAAPRDTENDYREARAWLLSEIDKRKLVQKVLLEIGSEYIRSDDENVSWSICIRNIENGVDSEELEIRREDLLMLVGGLYRMGAVRWGRYKNGELVDKFELKHGVNPQRYRADFGEQCTEVTVITAAREINGDLYKNQVLVGGAYRPWRTYRGHHVKEKCLNNSDPAFD